MRKTRAQYHAAIRKARREEANIESMTGLQQHWQLIGTATSGDKSNVLDAEGLTLAASLMANHPQLILPTCLLPNIMNYH